MRARFDHAVIVVDAVAAAAASFADAGFTVTPGGRHDAIPTENALVCFADGSYLELIAMRDPEARRELRVLAASGKWEAHLQSASAIGRRFLPRLAGPDGVADAVVGGERLARFAEESRRREFKMTGPVPMQRARAGAEALAWELLLPAEDGLPFLIEDRTPREWRVPGGAVATTHSNGANGITAVLVGAREPAALAMRLADLFEASLERVGPRTVAGFADLEWWIEESERDGANGVVLAGCGKVPPSLEALGVLGAMS